MPLIKTQVQADLDEHRNIYISLLHNKYTSDYFIDRSTRAKAEILLGEYYRAYPEDLNVRKLR
jgi:hypothetical protein